MAIDTPARIIIMGAGPVGIEAALYGRFLGYDVEVHDSLEPLSNVKRCGNLPLGQTFEQLSSPLGRAAIETQMPDHRLPGLQELLTAKEWLEAYLQPLSRVDLISDNIFSPSCIAQVARESWTKADSVDDEAACDELFLCRIENRSTGSLQETLRLADIVINASGTRPGQGGWGPGGLEPIGSRAISLQRLIRHFVPSENLPSYSLGNRVAVVGDSVEAQAQIAAMLETLTGSALPQITWITRPSKDQVISALDSLFRDALTAALASGAVKLESLNQVCSVHTTDTGLALGLLQLETESNDESDSDDESDEGPFVYPSLENRTRSFEVDTVFAIAPAALNLEPLTELKLSRDPSTEICLGETLPGIKQWNVMTSEPNFYVLGSASAGRLHEQFRFCDCLDQIRALFALIVDRPKLDLYRNTLPKGR